MKLNPKYGFFLNLCLFFSVVVSAQLPELPVTIDHLIIPKWVLISQPRFPGAPAYISIHAVNTAELNLDTSSYSAYQSYIQKLEDFLHELKEEKDDLDNQFSGSSGDEKINTGYERLKLMVVKQYEFGTILFPENAVWKGNYKLDMTAMNMLTLESGGSMIFHLSGFNSQSFHNCKLNDPVTNGYADFEVDMSKLGGGIMTGGITGGATWDGQIRGDAYGSMLNSTLETINSDGSVDISMAVGGVFALAGQGYVTQREGKITYANTDLVFLSPVCVGTTHSDGSTITTTLTYWDPLSGGFKTETTDSPSGLDKTPENKQPMVFHFRGWGIEECFQAFKNYYFVEYAGAADNEKKKEFISSGNNPEVARETLKLLLLVHTYGNQAGVDEPVITSSGLSCFYHSLYDQWFERYFYSKMDEFEKSIGSSSDIQTKISALANRFKWLRSSIAEYAAYPLSEQLTNELEFYYQSRLVNDVFEEYYSTEYNYRKQHLDALSASEKPAYKEEFSAWIKEIMQLGYSVVSDEKIIGLLNDIQALNNMH